MGATLPTHMSITWHIGRPGVLTNLLPAPSLLSLSVCLFSIVSILYEAYASCDTPWALYNPFGPWYCIGFTTNKLNHHHVSPVNPSSCDTCPDGPRLTPGPPIPVWGWTLPWDLPVDPLSLVDRVLGKCPRELLRLSSATA